MHPEWRNSNHGLLQGCPFSPMLLATTMALWQQHMRQQHPQHHADIFLDDRSAWITRPDAWTAMATFLETSQSIDAQLGFKENRAKTQLAVATPELQPILDSLTPEGYPEATTTINLLGLTYDLQQRHIGLNEQWINTHVEHSASNTPAASSNDGNNYTEAWHSRASHGQDLLSTYQHYSSEAYITRRCTPSSTGHQGGPHGTTSGPPNYGQTTTQGSQSNNLPCSSRPRSPSSATPPTRGYSTSTAAPATHAGHTAGPSNTQHQLERNHQHTTQARPPGTQPHHPPSMGWAQHHPRLATRPLAHHHVQTRRTPLETTTATGRLLRHRPAASSTRSYTSPGHDSTPHWPQHTIHDHQHTTATNLRRHRHKRLAPSSQTQHQHATLPLRQTRAKHGAPTLGVPSHTTKPTSRTARTTGAA